MRYIALLRGINVGGKNKVAMSELKSCFEALDFKNVMTYINSGNIIFDSQEDDEVTLVTICEAAIEKAFGFRVVCTVVSAKDLQAAAAATPEWWGQKGSDKHNALFVIPPLTAESVIQEVGDTKPEYEKVAYAGQVIFWTAPAETFSRTRYSKIVGTSVYKQVTIRNSNTFYKLLELSNH